MPINTIVSRTIVVTLLLSTSLFAALPGPIAHYTFDDGTAKDISGNKHHGKLVGEAKIVNDSVRGKVLQISSKSNSWVDCGGGGENGWATLTKTVTVSAWVKTKKFVADRQYIVSKGNNYALGRYGTSDHLRFFTAGFGTHDNEVEGKIDIQDGKWHLVTFVRDGLTGRRYVYVDAQIDSASSFIDRTLKANDKPLTIGGQPDTPNRCWVGEIDDVRIYDRPLSTREIRAMRRMGKAILPTPAHGTGNLENNIILHWEKTSPEKQKLYFGTDYYAVKNNKPSVYKGEIAAASFDPGPLTSGTTYYWKVNTGAIDEYVWSLRTKTEGFYMDFFKNGGLKLNGTTEMPAADLLALSCEYLSLQYGGDFPPEQLDIQNAVMLGSEIDENGVLLYPDGSPRFRSIYVAGGGSAAHGKVLTKTGRDRFRQFCLNGGGYSGSCAGAFIISQGTKDKKELKEGYFHIWPARTMSAGGIYKVGYELPEDSPILQYYDFGNDNYIANVQHWNGPYIISDKKPFWCENTEILARFGVVPEGFKNNNQGNVSLWAYKKNSYTGRIIPIASHPERAVTGELRDLMASILRYALDGQGNPKVKAPLKNNIARTMNDNNSPGHEKVGDKQYHHFLVSIPVGTKKLTIDLDGSADDDLNLYARRSGFAFSDASKLITAENDTGPDESITIENPAPGAWYIGVKGVNTVKTTNRFWGAEYTGNTHLLNGLAYSIKAQWDAPKPKPEKKKDKKKKAN